MNFCRKANFIFLNERKKGKGARGGGGVWRGVGGGNLIFLRCRRFYIVMEDATCRGLLRFFSPRLLDRLMDY